MIGALPVEIALKMFCSYARSEIQTGLRLYACNITDRPEIIARIKPFVKAVAAWGDVFDIDGCDSVALSSIVKGD